MKRSEIYNNFKKYVQQKDKRSMDAICASGDSAFKLQAQQNLLREYMQKYPEWKSLLLYHKIGSGKTCSAITMAEQYMNMVPAGRVKVILPARLKTNFLDELMTPCAGGTYISAEDYAKYLNQSTTAAKRKAIKAAFTKQVNKNYEIFSFEGVKSQIKKHKSVLVNWVKEFTKDSLIIIDEVHNLITDKFKINEAKKILAEGKMEKSVKGMNAVLLKLLTLHAHPSAKFVFLTATPVFDNIVQIRELVLAMDPWAKLPAAGKTTLKDVVEALRGKISYFPGTSENAYPAVEHVVHDIPLSVVQDIETALIQAANEGGPIKYNGRGGGRGRGGNKEDNNEYSEAFLSKQRQVSIMCTKDIEEAVSDLQKYAPKVLEVIKNIEDFPGKHLVYSSFIRSGLDVVAAALRSKGWTEFGKESSAGPHSHNGKVFAYWDGATKDVEKQRIKVVANGKDNIRGEKIRVILGSPSIKEGVSFKHIQHMHLLDPVWNSSAKDQVEGRAVRFCSHIDIDPQDAQLARKVNIHLYKIVPRKGGHVQMTCDQFIYDDLIPRKAKLVKAAENALKKVAIDHYLFRRMTHSVVNSPSPSSSDSKAASLIDLGEDEFIGIRRGVKKDGTTCPKARRPDTTVDPPTCKDGFEVRKNPQGHWCCYKTKRVAGTGTCPPKRRPKPDGSCEPGFKAKNNKHGEPCCFKVRKSNS